MTSTPSLLGAWSRRHPALRRTADAAWFEQHLTQVYTAAQGAWPGVELSLERFLLHVAERLPEEAASVEESLGALHCTDLYLACACAVGDSQALVWFDRQLLCHVPDYIAKLDSSRAFADEVIQVLRLKLFVAEGAARPKIEGYSGRGALGGWLRVVAVRTARNLQRAGRRSRPPTAAGREAARPGRSDPEASYLKEHYQREFRLALERSIASLDRQRRNVLRLYYLEQLSSTAIAAVYQVSGAAVRKWLKQARQSILRETRALLGERLGLDSGGLDSVMGLVQSQFELTVSRVLKATSSR